MDYEIPDWGFAVQFAAMKREKTVVIIGGGIGGLALAACLGGGGGGGGGVFEQGGGVRGGGGAVAGGADAGGGVGEVGAALAVWPNAGRVLERLGVFGWLRERSHEAPAGALRDSSGRVLMKMMRVEGEMPMVFSHRAILLEAVRRAVPEGWVRLGKR